MSFELPGRAGAIVNASVTTAQIFPDQINSSIACVIPVPGSGRLEQKRFRVLASGYATTAAATTTLAVTLYNGSSLAVASNTVIAALAATVVNNTTNPWWMEGVFVFDSVSGKLNGTFSGMISNTIIAAAAITPVTGLNGTTGPLGTEPVVNLCVGVTFGVNATGNSARLGYFTLLQP
jgi:hypothetical protein